MKNIFFFDSMLTPKIITFVYWLSLLGGLFAAIGVMFSQSAYAGVGIANVLGGVLLFIGIAIAARIYCEILIVIFKIHDNLKKLADK